MVPVCFSFSQAPVFAASHLFDPHFDCNKHRRRALQSLPLKCCLFLWTRSGIL